MSPVVSLPLQLSLLVDAELGHALLGVPPPLQPVLAAVVVDAALGVAGGPAPDLLQPRLVAPVETLTHTCALERVGQRNFFLDDHVAILP